VRHKSTHVTETVYRHVIVPQIRGGATVMDSVLGDEDDDTPEDKEAKSSAVSPLFGCVTTPKVKEAVGPHTAIRYTCSGSGGTGSVSSPRFCRLRHGDRLCCSVWSI
jgi:hypothetical protein